MCINVKLIYIHVDSGNMTFLFNINLILTTTAAVHHPTAATERSPTEDKKIKNTLSCQTRVQQTVTCGQHNHPSVT